MMWWAQITYNAFVAITIIPLTVFSGHAYARGRATITQKVLLFTSVTLGCLSAFRSSLEGLMSLLGGQS